MQCRQAEVENRTVKLTWSLRERDHRPPRIEQDFQIAKDGIQPKPDKIAPNQFGPHPANDLPLCGWSLGVDLAS